ncbi:MAG: ParA family protein [Anaerolineae bacterium]|nr:ParA family protein [Anaerolineae bacterium]
MPQKIKIIAVTNRKGGVGKSTMTTHIAAGLALAGLNVGIVDTDSQGHAGLMFGLPDENGLYEALILKKPLSEIVRLVPFTRYVEDDKMYTGGNLYVLPSSDLTYRVPYELQQHETFLFLEKLEELGDWLSLDVILIDTNPTLNMFDGAVYLAADAYIYVTECERLSMDGVKSAIEQMTRAQQQREKYLNRASQIMGIIPNKMRPSTTVHRSNISIIAEAFPSLVWSPVTLRTAWVEAANMQEMIYRYAPNGQECRDAYAIVTKTMEALRAQ